MPREVQDSENRIWSCVEAYAGLKENGAENNEIAKADTEIVEVVCTPNGGAKTVRLKLANDWENSLTDEDLLREIEANKNS